MSLTRKASSATKKPKPPRQSLAAALAERDAELAEARRETQEALERQKASADVLRVIGRSASDASPVFEAILEAGQRLFGSDEIGVYTIGDDRMVRVAAWLGPRAEEVRRDVTPLAESVTGRIIRERRTHHIPDLRDEPNLSPTVRERVERLGSASLLYAPMLWEDRGLGSILVARSPPRPFSDREQALLQSFADQAAIAIENARLFNEVKARTDELGEALQQQTATSEILRVISRSPTDARPVFDSIVLAAVRSLNCDIAAVLLRDGEVYHTAAGATPEGLLDLPPFRVPIDSSANFPSRAFLARETLYLPDWSQIDLPEHERSVQAAFGVNSALYLPLMREGESIGLIVALGNRSNAFGPTEIAQAESFRDQAVIAIENARLFDEVQAKTRDLEEALRQQTATADVLKAISRSAFDLDAVLDTLISTALRLCDAKYGQIFRRHGDVYRYAASRMEVADAYREHEKNVEIRAGRGTLVGRVALEKRAVEITDAWNDAEYAEKDQARIGKVRAMLGVPLLRNGEPIGAFALARGEPVPFTQRQVELVTTFADQAVIAIENVRLFDEVQAKTRDLEEALQQQTATADVLKVISRSAFDLDLAAPTILETAARLCRAPMATLHLRDGDVCRLKTQFGLPEAFERLSREHPLPVRYPLHSRRIAKAGDFAHFSDAWTDPDYLYQSSARLGGYRALVVVPLMREGELVGIFSLGRPEPEPFSESQIKLTQTFADQAAIAIENARLFAEVQAKTRDLEEALAQQTATADVLKVISRSTHDLQPVLDTLVKTVARLCDAEMAFILRRDGDLYRAGASVGFSQEYAELLQSRPVSVGRGTVTGRAVLERRAVQIADVTADPEYTLTEASSLTGQRTALGVPLIRTGEAIGVFVLARRRVEPFSQRQIELVTTFADQAVIAINNVDLFTETQEALGRQTATADVLKVISRSAFDLDVVFDALLASAVSLVGSRGGTICVRDGDVFPYRAVAEGRGSAMWAYLSSHPATPGRASVAGRVLLSGKPEIIADTLLDRDLKVPVHSLAGSRSVAGVPLLRENKVEGALMVGRAEPGPFDPRQIEVLQTFADQAVIAIENVRLLDEVQAKTRDLEESLQQQTATADVLKVISRSALDLDAVLETLVNSMRQLCNAPQGMILLRDGDRLRMALQRGYPLEFESYVVANPPPIAPNTGAGRAAQTRSIVHLPDVLVDPDYRFSEGQRLGHYRAMLSVPMLREDRLVGVFSLGRPTPGSFTNRQIELVQTFADQAVIAIENVRLFNEVQTRTRDLEESLQQQTATADVLKVISRSAFDLQAVLTTLAKSAQELCGASFATLSLRDGDAMRLRAESGCTPEIVDFMRAHPIRAGRETFTGRVMLSGEPVHVPDVLADPEYDFGEGPRVGNYRALLAVPLLREGQVEGVFALARPGPIPFTARQVEMVRAFADQAVIAIENARLFDEVQTRTKELAASLDDLRKAQDRLIQSEKLASLGQLTAGIAHEIKNPLNFVNNFSALSQELVSELADVIKAAPLDSARREEAEELIETIAGNLDKVVSHGKRADSIVKNMLLHSREGSGERLQTNINAMVEEALNLAYHGARAERPGFNVTIARSLDPEAGAAEVYAQEVTRVLLNLISNGFYATAKRKQAEADGAYEPTLTASTRNLGPSVEIAIRDNGTGIPDEVKAKMFNPFFTTKPAGEGTGLGLSLSHDIVVKQHGGTIEVSTAPGAYTEFTVVLPRGGPHPAPFPTREGEGL